MDGEDISLKVGKDSILLSKIREIRGQGVK
jgi:hypothetical protein